ncbi:putative fatty acyl-CoA reductase CG5065 [Bombus bifarius]|uniref:Fatty acyl-CoA reductase n=1 Tax=Bombus bifarius TaxID=103933 RepID=A0A6P8NTR4_9HYME|nr:putative fatty acyl-CoA reductase CG5065 [Bombus vancouverensis nearcticus]XP_033317532.1 putative fatty acyl-CoA reductase CG5065 [Bombus bifarius]
MKGTTRVIELWNELRHPISFVHISAANANLHEIEEKVYTLCSLIIDFAVQAGNLRRHIHIQEEFSRADLLVTIVRPNVIGASLEEPCPCWIQNISAFAGIFIGLTRRITIEQRFKKLIDDPIYDAIKAKRPSALNKVYPVKGDVSLPDLGLSREHRNLLLEEVNIVFHAAATVRFNEPLHVAVNVNTKGTARIIELWNELKHPISFVHVSTAFSNANLYEIGEKVYT